MPEKNWGRNPADIIGGRELFVRDASHGEALIKAKNVLSERVINRENFIDLYTEDAVARDTAYVKRMRATYEAQGEATDNTKLLDEKAIILQAMIHENGAEWLGDNKIRFIRTDDFDDIANGVDEVVSFPRHPGHSHLALNMDVTFAGTVDDKIKKIVDSMRRGTLSTIKYFSLGNFRGELRGVPNTVIGMHFSKLGQMQRLWLNPKVNMGAHPFRYFMLEELDTQISAFSALAKREGLTAAFRAYDGVKTCLEERRRAIGRPNEEIAQEIKDDPMVNRLKEAVYRFTK